MISDPPSRTRYVRMHGSSLYDDRVTSTACWRKSIAHADEIVDFAARLIRIPTVNPPGEEYEACAR